MNCIRKGEGMNNATFLENLLDGAEVEWMALGEVAEINTGRKPSEILDNATAFEYINAGTSRSGYCAKSNCEGNTVTTPSRGQGGDRFCWVSKDLLLVRAIVLQATVTR